MNTIKNYWLNLSDTTRAHIISSLKTFAAAGLATVLITLKSGIHWDVTFFSAIITAGFNSGIKALIETYAPPSLGGVKK